MKEIKSNGYLKKQAIYGADLPVGDPGLPGNITENDIPQPAESQEAYGQEGQIAIENYMVHYTYDYDYNDNYANNINITSAIITDPNILYELKENYEDQIRNDIEIGEENNKLERSPDYNPFE